MKVNNPKTKKIYTIFFVVILIMQLTYITYNFVVNKTAYHEDEFFSYGLANSSNDTFLYGSKLQTPDRYNVWMKGDNFKYYIRTNDDTKFSYATVWENQSKDTIPPLYYTIIHTISSIFANKFSWYWAYIVNIICVIISQLFVYKIFSAHSKSNLLGLIVCSFWMLTLTGQNTAYFLRMYAMLTMFGVIYVYQSQKILMQQDNLKKHDYIILSVIAFLGALTHHFFLVFAFFFTLCQCIALLIKKRFKDFFLYGISATIGIGLSFAAFPATFKHLFGKSLNWSGEIDPHIQFYLLLQNILHGITGFKTSIYMFIYKMSYFSYVIAGLVILLMIVLPLCFLVRNEKWFIKIANNGKIKIKKALIDLKKYDYTILSSVLSSLFLIIVASKIIYYYDVGEYVDRYFFVTTPFFCGAIISLFFAILSHIPKTTIKKTCILLLCTILAVDLIYQNVNETPRYILKNNNDNGKVCSYVKNNDCIVLLSSSIFLPCYCQMLENTNDIFITLHTSNEFKKQENEYKKVFNGQREVYLLFDTNNIVTNDSEPVDISELIGNSDEDTSKKKQQLKDTDIVKYFEKISGYKAEYCTKEQTHFCTAQLYKFTNPVK